MKKLIEHWIHPDGLYSVKTYDQDPQEFFDADGKQLDYDPRESGPVVEPVTPAPTEDLQTATTGEGATELDAEDLAPIPDPGSDPAMDVTNSEPAFPPMGDASNAFPIYGLYSTQGKENFHALFDTATANDFLYKGYNVDHDTEIFVNGEGIQREVPVELIERESIFADSLFSQAAPVPEPIAVEPVSTPESSGIGYQDIAPLTKETYTWQEDGVHVKRESDGVLGILTKPSYSFISYPEGPIDEGMDIIALKQSEVTPGPEIFSTDQLPEPQPVDAEGNPIPTPDETPEGS